MKNYWLEKIRKKQELEERWTPPTNDEDGWWPIRPPGSHQVPVNCCASNYDSLPQDALAKCDKRWERMEIMCSNHDIMIKDDKYCGAWDMKNVTIDENLKSKLDKLEVLKLQVMAENPQYIGVPVPDHIVLDTTNIPTEISLDIPFAPEEPMTSYDEERAWYLDL